MTVVLAFMGGTSIHSLYLIPLASIAWVFTLSHWFMEGNDIKITMGFLPAYLTFVTIRHVELIDQYLNSMSVNELYTVALPNHLFLLFIGLVLSYLSVKNNNKVKSSES
tara:strand:- start:519 stop:845 length:327 start_codon:yes stop_codon:yes gene_type:complete